MPDAATTAWVNAVIANGGTVSAGRETIVDNLIVGLKADGLFTKLDRLWLFAAENAPSALTDIIADSLATATNAPTFVVDQGYSGGATNILIDSNVDVATFGGNFSQNSACVFGWYYTGGQAGGSGGLLCGCTPSAGSIRIIPQFSDNATYWVVNGDQVASNLYSSNSAPKGLYVVVRTGANAQTLDVNGVQVASDAGASSIPFANITALGDNNQGNSNQASCLGFGGSLSGMDRANLYTRLLTYMIAVGVVTSPDKQASITFANAGALRATANLAALANLTFAGSGILNANTRSAQVASLTVAVTGRLNVNSHNDKPAFLKVTVTGLLSANIINSRATTTITFAGASSFRLNTRSAQSAMIDFAGGSALFADAVFGAFPTLTITGELVLIGTESLSEKFIPGEIITKDTRYIYIGYDRVISGRPSLNFLSSHDVDLSLSYPTVQIGTRNIVTPRGYFPLGTYIKAPLDITKLLTSAGVWTVSAYTIGAALPAGNTIQHFYMSVED